jgi:hypothetical protein
MEEQAPSSCKYFTTCNTNLCPLDKEIGLRTWFIGEDVCKSRDHATDPMIRRQKQLNRLRPLKYTEKPLSAEWLSATAPQKRILSPEEKAERLARLNRKKASD